MPRTLAQNAQYIAETIKPAIKQAIEDKGVTVPSTDSFLDYADRIGEISGGGSGYQLKDLPTGSISTVSDAEPLPLNALTVSVEAWQEGSGDPSPSNIRPIHGWDSGEIITTDTMPTNSEYSIVSTQSGSGIPSLSNVRPIVAGLTFERDDHSTLTVYDGTLNVMSGLLTATYFVYEVTSVNRSNSRQFYKSTSTIKKESDYSVKADKIQSAESSSDRGVFINSSGAVRFNTEDEYATAEDMMTAYGGSIKVWCQLAEAQTYQLSDAELQRALTALDIRANIYTLNFPTTIYGAEWDVANGSLTVDSLCFTISDFNNWYYQEYANFKALYKNLNDLGCPPIKNTSDRNAISDKFKYVATGTQQPFGAFSIYTNGNIYFWNNDNAYANKDEMIAAMNNIKPTIIYELATPTTIPQQAESIRMLEGVNNLYADCGDVLEGEYFVDEGAIDVRKVDYSIGSNSALKISDGRILQGFANMTNYHSRPLDASENWLDVDWSKDFEIGVAFKLTSLPTYQFLFGCGLTTNDRFNQPRLFYDNSTQTVELNISTDGSSWESITLTNNSIIANKWYFVKIKFTLSTLKLIVSISEDLSTFATMCDETLSGAVYHNSASLSIGGDTNNSAMTSNDCMIDTFNTYIKGDGVNWGAFTGAFPS